MRRILTPIFALIAAGFLGFSGIAAGAAATRAAPSPALWSIEGGKGEVVVLGSIHLLKPGTAWLSDDLKARILAADTVTVEIDKTPEATARIQALTQAKGFYGTERTLSAAVPPETYKSALAIATAMGIPETNFQHFRPWSASLIIGIGAVMKAGFDPAHGVEETILGLVRPKGTPIQSLETADEVISAMADHPESLQADMLRQSVEEFDDVTAMLDDMTKAWLSGDVKGLEDFLLVRMKEVPAFYDAVLVKRNQAWAPRVAAVAETPGRHFVMVGAAHLLGEDSLLKLMEKAGYKVRRLK